MPQKKLVKKEVKKEVKKSFSRIVSIIGWITGVIVALAVGFGMADRILTVPWLTRIGFGVLVVWAGWIVVILTIIGAIMAIIDAFR